MNGVIGTLGTAGGWSIAAIRDFAISPLDIAALLLVTLPTGLYMWWKLIDKWRESRIPLPTKNEEPETNNGT